MKFSFRKWLFNLLTGYDFVEYEEILREWHETLQLAERVNNNCQKLIDASKEVIDVSRKIIKENKTNE